MLNILFISSFLALAVGSIPLWLNVLARRRSTGEMLESRETAGSPFGFLDIVVMFFFWFVGQLGSVGVATTLMGVELDELASLRGADQAWFMITTAFGQLAATFLAMGLLLFRYGRISIFGWQPANLKRDLRLGGQSFVLVVPSVLFVQWLLTQIFEYTQPTLEMLAKNADALTIVAAWFGAVLVAPICEEVFFRGVLQAWLQRLGRSNLFSDQVLTGGWDPDEIDAGKVNSGAIGSLRRANRDESSPTGGSHSTPTINPSSNPYAAPRSGNPDSLSRLNLRTGKNPAPYWPIVVSAAIFGLAHLGQGPAPIPLFLFGLALGYLYRKTGSITPCIILHMLLNGFSMFWFTINVLYGSRDTETEAAISQVGTGLTSLFL